MAKHTEKPARMAGNSLSPQKELLAAAQIPIENKYLPANGGGENRV